MRRYVIAVEGKEYEIFVRDLAPDSFHVRVEGRQFEVRLLDESELPGEPRAEIRPLSPAQLPRDEGAPPVEERAPPLQAGRVPAQDGAIEVRAPMPGTILNLDVAVGERVEYGQRLLMLEAMKMKNPIRAPVGGEIIELLVATGQSVAPGTLLLRLRRES